MALYLVVTNHGPANGTYFLSEAAEKREIASRPLVGVFFPRFLAALASYRIVKDPHSGNGERPGRDEGGPGRTQSAPGGTHGAEKCEGGESPGFALGAIEQINHSL